MIKFVIASGNKHKIEEIKAIMQSELDCEISVISMKEAGFFSFSSMAASSASSSGIWYSHSMGAVDTVRQSS